MAHLLVVAARRGAVLVDRLVISAGLDHRRGRRRRLGDHDRAAAAAGAIAVTIAVAVAVAGMRRRRRHVPDPGAAPPAIAFRSAVVAVAAHLAVVPAVPPVVVPIVPVVIIVVAICVIVAIAVVVGHVIPASVPVPAVAAVDHTAVPVDQERVVINPDPLAPRHRRRPAEHLPVADEELPVAEMRRDDVAAPEAVEALHSPTGHSRSE